jgi:hypothetical protein
MRQVWSGELGRRRVVILWFCLLAFTFCCGARAARAQTQQAYLFATTQVSSNSAVATFTRNDTTGALTEVAGSPFVLLTSNCYPSTMDPKGRYLMGSCGDGISLYQFNSATGVVSEVPNSPFAASTGGPPDAVLAESTGQFAYALRITRTTFPTPSTATLDSFAIDATNNVLNQPSSQTFTLPGTYIGLVTDPNGHFIEILTGTSGGLATPLGQSCAILFDPQTGLPVSAGSSLCQSGASAGSDPLGISIDARGTFIGTASKGQFLPSFDVSAISLTNGSIDATGNYSLTQTGDYLSTPFFDPTGQLAYANTQLAGLRIFSLSVTSGTVAITELPSSPLPSNVDPTPLSALPDPAGDFTYIGGSNVITTYPIDTTTGYPGTPISNSFNHSPALNFQPVYATLPAGGQVVSAPAISLSVQSLSFGPINPGQISGPQVLTVSSTGNQALTISSIAFSPAGGPFLETDTCISNPVLPPGSSCQISVSYAPTSVGTAQAALIITDNAAGSPQSVALAGTAQAPPPPAPEVTLVPGTLTFPGTTTEGESSAPQPITITNSGNATLTFSAAPMLSGVNTADFAISSNTCAASLAANASCTVSVIFSPLAAGVRTTSLVLADNASSSPQSVTINGTGVFAATVSAQSGNSASVSAGQAATFNLQATPGAGFNGNLSFACAGAPAAAACSAPGVTVANGATTNFTVVITTSGSAALAPAPRINWRLPAKLIWPFSSLLLAMLAGWLCMDARRRELGPDSRPFLTGFACFVFLLAGCGGGAGNPASQTQPVVTPSGTYTITITPTATPSGSSKAFTLNAITLTLVVK